LVDKDNIPALKLLEKLNIKVLFKNPLFSPKITMPSLK
jgi:hypothetical protein